LLKLLFEEVKNLLKYGEELGDNFLRWKGIEKLCICCNPSHQLFSCLLFVS